MSLQQEADDEDTLVTVVADDLGMNTFRTDGILECFRAGNISASSLMVTGDDAVRAVKLARSAGLPLGLHFNLTEGQASSFSSSFSSAILTRNDGSNTFRGKQGFFESVGNAGLSRAALQQVNSASPQQKKFSSSIRNSSSSSSDEVQNEEAEPELKLVNAILGELSAQLARFEQLTGTFPFYLDGHHHVQALPVVAQALLLLFRCPMLSDLTPEQRGIIGQHLPGSSAAAAVRALKYLRVPLPPLGDRSRQEGWRSGDSAQDAPMWRADTVVGPPFFPRVVECAYSAMALWERAGLFGPVGVDSTSVAALDGEMLSNAVAASSPARQLQRSQEQKNLQQQQQQNASSHIVDQISPLRRRGVVVVVPDPEEEDHQQEGSSGNLQQQILLCAPPGVAHAIIPRRLVSFASGPDVNANMVTESLSRFREEQQRIARKRNIEIGEEKEEDDVMIRLFERAKLIGSVFPSAVEADRQICVPSWVSRCEPELMCHPGEQIPPLPSMVAAQQAEAKQKQQQDAEEEAATRDKGAITMREGNAILSTVLPQQPFRPSDAEVFSYYGPTREFYCTWSQSHDRVKEREFLCSDEFLQSVADARYGVKPFSLKLLASGRF